MTKKLIDRTAYQFDSVYRRPVEEFISDLRDAVESIPEARRSTAFVTIDTESDPYGDGDCVCGEVQYTDLETDAEETRRETQEAALRAQMEAYERRQFEALAKKFGKKE